MIRQLISMTILVDLVQLLTFFSVWRFARHLIPKDFHPAATSAILIAFSYWIASLIYYRITHCPEESPLIIGWVTATLTIGLAGLCLGLGESCCSAWMLAALALVIALTATWHRVTDEFLLYQSYCSSDEIRRAWLWLSILIALVLFFLAPVAHFLNW